jgi:hypothetical protein
MNNLGLAIFAIAIAFAVITAILWPRTIFLIEVENKEAKLTRGKIAPRLVGEFSSIIAEVDSFRGRIRGVNQIGKFSIRYEGIPEYLQQRFKNLWGIYMRK